MREVNVLDLARANGQVASTDPLVMRTLGYITSAVQKTGVIAQSSDPLLMTYTWLTPAEQVEHQPAIRIDYNLATNHRLTGTFNKLWQDRNPDQLNEFDQRWPDSPNYGHTVARRRSRSLALRSTLSSNQKGNHSVTYGGGAFLGRAWDDPQQQVTGINLRFDTTNDPSPTTAKASPSSQACLVRTRAARSASPATPRPVWCRLANRGRSCYARHLVSTTCRSRRARRFRSPSVRIAPTASRIQARTLNFGNVRLVGMTAKDLQKMYKFDLRVNPANGLPTPYLLPADVILNTRRAFSVSTTSTTGYSDLGVPEGRYIAPANHAGCIQLKAGDCAPRTLLIRAPFFTRFDVGLTKRLPLKGRVNIELRVDVLNIFDNINFTPVAAAGSGATIFQATSAYRDPDNTFGPGGRIGQLGFRLNW